MGCVGCEVGMMRREVMATKSGCAGDGNREVQAAERAHAEVGRAEYDALSKDKGGSFWIRCHRRS